MVRTKLEEKVKAIYYSHQSVDDKVVIPTSLEVDTGSTRPEGHCLFTTHFPHTYMASNSNPN